MPNRTRSILLFLLTMVLTTGCSTIQRMTNSDHMSNDERIRIIAEHQKESAAETEAANRSRDEKQQYFQDLKPNLTKAEVIQHVGDPNTVEFVNSQYLLFFLDQEVPMVLTFDKQDLLTGWQIDKETIRQRQAQQDAEDKKEEQRRERRRQAIMAIGQAFQQPAQQSAYQQPYIIPTNQNRQINCTSSRYGNQTYTNCN